MARSDRCVQWRTQSLSALSALALLGVSTCVGKMTDAVTPLEQPTASAVAPAQPTASPEWRASLKSNGEITLFHKGNEVAKVSPGLFDEKWQHRGVAAMGDSNAPAELARSVITAPDGSKVDAALRWSRTRDGVRLHYTLTPRADVKLNSLHVALDVPINLVSGRSYSIDGERREVPVNFGGQVQLGAKQAKSVDLDLSVERSLRLRFESPTHVMVQDNRQWGPTLSLRIGTQQGPVWKAGQAMSFAVDMTADGGIEVDKETPVTIEQGPDWTPLAVDLDIAAGSVLDMSAMRPTGAPAGKQGRVITRQGGGFAFEQEPAKPQRFYGVNLAFSAHYISHEQSDRLAVRLARLGYNTLRVHHHESELISARTAAPAKQAAQKPSSVSELERFEAPANAADNYSARMRGFLHPPATGDYVFKIRSDDESELLLSSDDNPANAKKVAFVDGWTTENEWDKYGSQASKPVRLEAGKKYYIEATHREGAGGDHLAVGWSGPGLGFAIVDGKYLSPLAGGTTGKIGREVFKQKGATNSVTLNPDKLDQLDYLISALKKNGIYVTTDLFVSRPVLSSEIWPGTDGTVSMNDFKMAVPVNEKAFANWKKFSKNLLTHKNPYTGKRWADDEAIGWLSMINEGNFGNYLGTISERVRREWQVKWNAWLRKSYKDKATLQKAWGVDPQGDPARGTVPFTGNPYEDQARERDLMVFLTDVERRMFERMRRFLRDEVGTKALLTNMNAWTNRTATQIARVDYDYVDDHFYVDHPQWVEAEWKLPSRSPNTSPIAEGAPGGRPGAFLRLFDKPFTVSEYNYSGPGRFRGVGGILTGALAALQDWDVIWRFAYSHNRDYLFKPTPISYFDVGTDPLNLAAERASIALFLRGDMKRNEHAVAIAMTEREVLETRKHNRDVAPGWHALAWVTRVGTVVAKQPGPVPANVILPLGWDDKRSAWSGGEVIDVDPYDKDTGNRVLEALHKKRFLPGNRTNLKENVLQSETKQLLIDAPRDMLVLDTPRTAGGYAPEGQNIETQSVKISIVKTDATVWASAMDDKPLRDSRRILITHLTDLQNHKARFAEKGRQTLLDWGKLPHLVRSGSATIVLKIKNPGRAKVWAISTGGKRLAKVEASVRDGALVVPLDVAAKDGARMLYEVAVE